MIKGSGMFETEGKTLYKCIKQFASEQDQYGIDFIEGKEYYGEREDEEGYYIDSTENGTCVYVTNEEMKEYFVVVNEVFYRIEADMHVTDLCVDYPESEYDIAVKHYKQWCNDKDVFNECLYKCEVIDGKLNKTFIRI